MEAEHSNRYGRCDTRHELVVSAEVRRLERALHEWGPLPREKLAALSGVAHWSDGTMDEVLRAGEEAGLIRRLPLGWVQAIPES